MIVPGATVLGPQPCVPKAEGTIGMKSLIVVSSPSRQAAHRIETRIGRPERSAGEPMGLKSLAGRLASEFLLGHAMEFRIHQLKQLFVGIALATLGRRKQSRHIAHRPCIIGYRGSKTSVNVCTKLRDPQ